MATTNSGHCYHHHYPPNFAPISDRRTTSTDDEDSDNFQIFKLDVCNTHNVDADHHPINPDNPISKTSRKQPLIKPHRRPQRTIPITGKSLPVNIPDWEKILRDSYKSRSDGDHFDGDYDDDGGDDWLPPHEYLARIRSASLSVHEGVGRTLKGRDLSRLRNAIWKQTGFGQD